MNRFFRSALFPLVIIAALVWLALQTLGGHEQTTQSETTSRVHPGRSGRRSTIDEASSFDPNKQSISRHDQDGKQVTVHYATRPVGVAIEQAMRKQQRQLQLEGRRLVAVVVDPHSLLPFVLLFGFWIFLMNQVQGGGSKVMSFGKSRAKRMTPDAPKIGFKDVAGVDEAVEELQEIKEFLENPKKFQALGARIPKGVLLYGPPGTGKTLLARAVAGEAGVPFFSISGSDFVEMFVGVGASRVRDLFEQAKQATPASSSWTRSTPSAAIVAPVSAAATTSASRR